MREGLQGAVADAGAVKPPEPTVMPKLDESKIKIDPKEFEGLGYALIGMALVGGATSRGNWLAASASLNGAMRGFHEGKQLEAQKEYKRYETEFKAATDAENRAQQKYKDILDNKRLTINDQLQMLRVVATENGHTETAMRAAAKDLTGAIEHIEARKQQMLGLQVRQDSSNVKLMVQIDQQDKKRAAGEGVTGGLSTKYNDDAEYRRQVDYYARMVNLGLNLPPRFAQNVGKNFAHDVTVAATMQGTMDPADVVGNKAMIRELNAESQKLGTQAGSVKIAVGELDSFVPLAREASEKVNRAGWRPVNQLTQLAQDQLSAAQKDFLIKNRSVQTAFSQVISRGAPTVHSSEEAEHMLLTADSKEVYDAALKALVQDSQGALQGLNEAHNAHAELISHLGTPGNQIPPKGIPGSDIPPKAAAAPPKPAGMPQTYKEGGTSYALMFDGTTWGYAGKDAKGNAVGFELTPEKQRDIFRKTRTPGGPLNKKRDESATAQ